MNTDVINTSYDHLSDPNLLAKGNTIYLALINPTNSVTYAAVTPTTADLLNAITNLRNTVGTGKNPDQVALRHVHRQSLLDILVLMGVSLESISPADRVLLSGTGYDLHKIWERDTTPTGTPENVKVKATGIPGEAKLSASAVHQATAYEGRATQDMANGPFVNCPPATAIRHLHFTGLERGKDWYFQMRAIGPNGVGPWSDPAMMMVI